MNINEVPYEDKVDLCEDYGWVEYHGKTVIKPEWVNLNRPLGNMSVPVDEVYMQLIRRFG